MLEKVLVKLIKWDLWRKKHDFSVTYNESVSRVESLKKAKGSKGIAYYFSGNDEDLSYLPCLWDSVNVLVWVRGGGWGGDCVGTPSS